MPEVHRKCVACSILVLPVRTIEVKGNYIKILLPVCLSKKKISQLKESEARVCAAVELTLLYSYNE
jgi:hypothetical protein